MDKPVVLIVDDVPDLLQIMEEAVRMTFVGYDVLTAPDGESGFDALNELAKNKRRLALVVSDQTLGDRTGLELLRHARSTGAALVLVTGRATAEVEAEAALLGAHLLWKPFRLNKLMSILREAVPTVQ